MAGSGKTYLCKQMFSLDKNSHLKPVLVNNLLLENSSRYIRFVFLLPLLLLLFCFKPLRSLSIIALSLSCSAKPPQLVNYLVMLSVAFFSRFYWQRTLICFDQGLFQAVASLAASCRSRDYSKKIMENLDLFLPANLLPDLLIHVKTSDYVCMNRLYLRGDCKHSRMFQSGPEGHYWIEFSEVLDVLAFKYKYVVAEYLEIQNL